jgi:signal transduction histidine kinase/ActR/RegA family two-component response regulator
MDVHATPPTGPARAARDRAYDRLCPNSPFPAAGGEGGDLLRTLISRDPDGLMVVDRADNVIRFANPAAAALLGRPGVDLRGERLGTTVAPGQTVEWEVSRANGPPHLIELTGVEVEWSGAAACLVSVHDVTDARRVAHAYSELLEKERALRAAAEENDRRKDEYLAMLAHELRNPLAPLRNALYMLRRPDTIPAHQQWAWDVVRRQVRQLGQLVDGLIDAARVTRGRVELKREVVDLAALVRGCCEIAKSQFAARRHEWLADLPDRPLRVEGDPLRLEQIVANLLDNAAKYTAPGGRVEISLRREGREAILDIRDTGTGIAPVLLPRIFNLFERADRSLDRGDGGLGIGLTLVRKLTELHGGSVNATSAGVGKGSCFTVRLPALVEKAGPDPPAEPTAQRRVLVVDDNRDLAESLGMVLRLWGHDVKVVYDGPGALAAAREYRPDVIFLDIGLPGLDGYEVARRLRGPLGFRDARVVAITGYGREEDRRKAREAGFDMHLTKPVDPEDLQKLLQSTEPSNQ